MSANALLVRWAGGWSEVRDDASIAANGRREALLGLGAVHGRDEMERMARAQLVTYAETRTEVACDLKPVSLDDMPYLGFGVGDTITVPTREGGTAQDRVMALTVSEDDDGVLSFAPEINDVILRRPERTSQAIKKMVDGTMQGDSRIATPVANIQTNSGIYAPSAVSAGGLPPAAALSGHTDAPSGISMTPPPAEMLWMSASAGSYVEAVDAGDVGFDDGGTVIKTLQTCDLLIVMNGFWNRTSDVGGLQVGVWIDATTIDDAQVDEFPDGFIDLYEGRLKNADYTGLSHAGMTFARSYRCTPGCLIVATIDQDTGATRECYWKLSLVILEPTTFTALGGET